MKKNKRTENKDNADVNPLNRDIPEDYLESTPGEMETETSASTNWVEPQDRGEDLANIRDPFIHEPERDMEDLPELNQKRPGKKPQVDENLADLFDAERKSRPSF